MRQKVLAAVKRYLGIIFGSLITAIGLNALEIPNKIAAGGASGIATIVYHLTGIEPGIMIFLINVPLLVICGLLISWRYSWYSVIGALATSAWVYFTGSIAVWTDNALLAAIYGGIVTGVGMGIVFRSQGSTGGTDMLARLLNHFTGLPVGEALLLIDGSIVAAAAWFFGAELAMFALIAIFVTTKVIDYVQDGFYSVKALFIISDQSELIATDILQQMGRGVTFLHGEGGYSRLAKRTILAVVSRSEMSAVKGIVERHDPSAFVIVVEAHEVLGEGFQELSTTI